VDWIMSTFWGMSLRSLSLSLGLGLLLSACTDGLGPGERLITVEVAATRVPCVGLVPQECLQVRRRADAAWERFYDPIEGFTHEAGFQYRLRLVERVIANPPADGSSRAYRLVAVLAKVPVESAGD
jgi:hypothetical protein